LDGRTGAELVSITVTVHRTLNTEQMTGYIIEARHTSNWTFR